MPYRQWSEKHRLFNFTDCSKRLRWKQRRKPWKTKGFICPASSNVIADVLSTLYRCFSVQKFNLFALFLRYSLFGAPWQAEKFHIQSRNRIRSEIFQHQLESHENLTYNGTTFIHPICKLYKSHHRSKLCLHSSRRLRASRIWWFWLDRAREKRKWPLVVLW